MQVPRPPCRPPVSLVAFIVLRVTLGPYGKRATPIMASRGPVLTQGRGAAPVAERSSGGLALGEVAWPGMYVCVTSPIRCVFQSPEFGVEMVSLSTGVSEVDLVDHTITQSDNHARLARAWHCVDTNCCKMVW